MYRKRIVLKERMIHIYFTMKTTITCCITTMTTVIQIKISIIITSRCNSCRSPWLYKINKMLLFLFRYIIFCWLYFFYYILFYNSISSSISSSGYYFNIGGMIFFWCWWWSNSNRRWSWFFIFYYSWLYLMLLIMFRRISISFVRWRK